MFKKRNVKQPTRRRELSSEAPNQEEERTGSNDEESELPIEDLIGLRKLRKARQGIELDKLNKGDVKRKRRKVEDEPEEQQFGLQNPRPGKEEEDAIDTDDEEAKARKLVRSNNFTQQTNKLDVDKHMMAYIEENMKVMRGEASKQSAEEAPWDPHAQLYQIDDRYRVKKKELEEGSVTNSMAMLTSIPEVDLGIDVRLRNIEDTEKAKRTVEDEKRAKQNARDQSDAHLAATRFYLPRAPTTSDSVALRNAQLEAMGVEVPEPKRNLDRKEVATDDVVMERFKKRMRR